MGEEEEEAVAVRGGRRTRMSIGRVVGAEGDADADAADADADADAEADVERCER